MNAFARFHAWWQARDGRERVMLGVMFTMLAAFVYWYALLAPLRHLRDDAIASYDRAAADAMAVRAQVAALDARTSAALHLDAAAIGRVADASGIAVDRASATSTGAVEIGIEHASPAALSAWLDRLARDHGVIPGRLRMEARDGELAVDIVLPVQGGTP